MSVLDLKTWKHDRDTTLALGQRWRDYPAGPWDDEPDKAQWVDEATDLDCLIVRNPFGALCGYVGLPPGHPHHGSEYDDVPVEIHGGLTFAGECSEDRPEGYGICHVPAEGRPADVFWLGFDCAHAGDMTPSELGRAVEANFAYPFTDPRTYGDVYRDFAYVTAEVTDLAKQLAALA